jgi:hypothetical protein
LTKANSVYFDLSSGNLSFSIAGNPNAITSNDDWSGVASVEGYFGQNLTATHGVDPQTILTAEFTNSTLPNSPTNVSANKGNPSAFNAGGVAEFDGGTYIATGLQGNVQANPYLVFYLNTTARSNITVDYSVQDIDGGSNDSVSRVALQYRVGQTGNFTNIPAGFIADATDGGAAGRVTLRNVVLPAAANNQAMVQVRLLTTNAANSAGGSTPDEWIGINSVTIGSSGPTAAGAVVSGRVTDHYGRGIRNAIVVVQDMSGTERRAVTGTFGYFVFENIQAGSPYIFEVVSKRYVFYPSTQMRVIVNDVADINFVAEPAKLTPATRFIGSAQRRSVQD